ncbi:MAG: response regulator [Phycisphaeraceae bacterium]|nr:response regulator [Phycisphaeraceae bacterium]
MTFEHQRSVEQTPLNQAAPSVQPSKTSKRPASWRALLVDVDPQAHAQLQASLKQIGACKLQAVSDINLAMEDLSRHRYDVVIACADQNEAATLQVTKQIQDQHPGTESILLSKSEPTKQMLINAMRSGACDILHTPLNSDEMMLRLQLVHARAVSRRVENLRIRKLQKTCDKLTQAHQDVSRQVDVLCNDLVHAYHDLASQMHQTVQNNDFLSYVGNELDLEHVLRRTLEYVLEKAGPTNAAVFLPAIGDEYSLGGYVNLDGSRESTTMILQHLADVVAPKMVDRPSALHITDNQTLGKWIGADAAYLEDAHVLAVRCHHEDETLAVLVTFRDQSTPFDLELVQTFEAISTLLAEQLARVIRIHHRHLPYLADDDEPAFRF